MSSSLSDEILQKKCKIHSSWWIEYFVETHFCKLVVCDTRIVKIGVKKESVFDSSAVQPNRTL